MPNFDFSCPSCTWTGERLVPSGTLIDCPDCGTQTEKIWTTRGSGVQDDSYVGGLVLENLGPVPIRVYSRSEHNAILKARGLVNMVRHATLPDTDKSPHTSRWVSAPQDEAERLEHFYATSGFTREQVDALFRERHGKTGTPEPEAWEVILKGSTHA